MQRFLFILAILALLAFLFIQFPYALQEEYSRSRLLYLVLLLAFGFGWGGWLVKGRELPKVFRDAAIWLGLLLLLVLGYSFRDDLKHTRLMAELIPQRAQVNGDGTLSIRSSEGGHFLIEAEVNDVPVRFMIDTGASDIVLSPYDAKRVGLSGLEFTRDYSTANGYGKGAPVKLATLKVGNILLHDIPAAVNRAEMDQSLLGMSFLNRLHSFRVEGNTLVLTP